METLEQKIARVVSEEVEISPYDDGWPEMFSREKAHLLSCLPSELIVRIEHFGSTAVQGLSAKPIIDMLVEVTDLEATRERIAPLLESQGYDYFWRPTRGDDGPPFYAWFIKRDPRTGKRTHHIHMVDAGFTEHWDRLLFRDYLIEHPQVALEYELLKLHLASASAHDRVAYTRGKTEFIEKITETARRLNMQITIEPIGYVRNARRSAEDDNWDAVESEIVLDDSLEEECLDGIESFSHIIVIFRFHLVDESGIEKGARRPRNNKDWPRVGIFAQRGKNRPNRLGVTTARLVGREGRRLSVAGLDAIDGTPVLDIKPVMKEFLPREEIRQPEWSVELMRNYWQLVDEG